MPTFNQGIRTNAGYNLFGRVQSGQTKIHYTKVIFSSLDLSNKTDDDIQNMTDVNPKELIIPQLQVLYKPKTDNSDQETEIRAMGSNEILKKGFYINTYALYAADDSGNEILYGVSVDNNPSWLPAYDGVRPQSLTYNWDTGDKDTNNVHFTDSHDAYATYGDFQDFNKSIQYQLNTNQIPTGTDLNDLSRGNYAGLYNRDYQHCPVPKGKSFNISVLDDGGGDKSQLIMSPVGIFYRSWWTHGSSTPDWQQLTSSQRTTDAISQLNQSITDNFNKSQSTLSTNVSNLQNQLNTNQIPSGTDLNDLSRGNYAGLYNRDYQHCPVPKGKSFNINVLDDGGGDKSQLIMSPVGIFYRSWWTHDSSTPDWQQLTSSQRTTDAISQLNQSITETFNQANSYTDNQINAIKNNFAAKNLPNGADLSTLSSGKYIGTYNNNYRNCPVTRCGFIIIVDKDNDSDTFMTLKSTKGLYVAEWWVDEPNGIISWEKL